MIEVDPRIEQAFADVLARSRHRAADITERLAAQQREMAERSQQIVEEGKALSEEMDRRVAERLDAERNNPWQTRETKPTVLAFGAEDEDGRKPAPPQPAVPAPPAASYPPPPPAPEPEPAPAPEPANRFLSFDVDDEETGRHRPAPPQTTRPAPSSDDDDDDYSGRSWVR